MKNTSVYVSQASSLSLGHILKLTTQGIDAGGLLRWRGADLKSPLVLESIKTEFSKFAESSPLAESLDDLWSRFIYQF